MKRKKLIWLFTVLLAFSACDTVDSNNISDEERLTGVWKREYCTFKTWDLEGNLLTNETNKDEADISFLESENRKHFPKYEENQFSWWGASDDTIYIWSVEDHEYSSELNKDGADKHLFVFKGDSLKISSGVIASIDSDFQIYGSHQMIECYTKIE